MADMSAPSGQAPAVAPLVRTDDEIFPYNRWVQIGKSNCSLNLNKKQSNLIFKMAVDLLMHTNFHRAFTASSTIPTIYIQQFWDTIQYDKKAGNYRCQLDEQWFVLTKDTLREALQIIPINNTQALVAPLSAEVLVDLVNQLGYPKMVRNVSNIVTNDMFQPWRALTTIINLCLTEKTLGFERPRAPVLQILWGIVTQSNIDYAERIWEEFTQSIHTFMEDKRNLSRHTTGKKRATLILISSIRFTKLIIHHLQRRHKFHPRPDSTLYLANDDPVLGYLKFSAKGTKREVFGMPIPGRLITAHIREDSYYQEFQENVAKHRGFLAGETGSTQDLPAPKPAKPARKPKSTAQKAPPKPSISTLVTSTQPAPTSTPAKSQENKRKQTTETTDKPAKGKRIKHSISRKTRQSRSSLKSVGASEAEEVPAVEPRVADEEADYQKAVEESLKTAHAVHRGPLPPLVIREHESGKYQPPPEVPGKGKAKVTEEQVAHDLLSLQKAKRKDPVEQYIFQRRIFEPTGSSFHDESPYDVLGQSDSEEESKKVLTRASEGGNDAVQTGLDHAIQNEGQKETDDDTLDEGQAGSNPDKRSEGQAGLDPGITENEEQSIPNLMVHAGSDREYMDLDVTKASPQPSMEQLDEWFLATAYPKIQESLKLAVEEQVLPIQQATSLISISLMTSPIIDLSSRPVSPKVHQQFKATTTDTTTTTTTTVPPPQAQQQSTTEAMMVKRIGKLEHILADLIQVNKNIEERLDKHGARLYTLKQLDIPQQVSIVVSEVVTDAVDWAMQAPLRNRFKDLPEADMKEILHQRMWETESYKTHEDHSLLFKALENSMIRNHFKELAQDLAEAHKKKRKRRESPKTPPGSPPHQPPPPPPPTGPSRPSKAPGASGSQVTPPPPPPPPLSTSQDSPSKGSAAPIPSKTAFSTEHQAWTTPDVTLRPFISLTPADLDMDEAMEERVAMPEPACSIPSSDAPVTLNNWASALASDYSPPPEDSLLAQTDDMATFINWFCKRRECHKLLTDSLDNSIPRNNVSKPLPLGGPPGQVTIQSDFLFNKDLEYLRYGSKGNRPALSISKMKATYYLDVGLEQMVPDHFWINEECKYDIAAMTHMWILCVVRIEVFSMYGYDYMKKIVLHRADLNEHIIAERDFKYLYPSDFEDLYLLNLQGHLNHIPPKDKRILSTAVNQWIRQLVIRQRVEDFQLGIESYQTQLNLTKPQWDATGFEYKHDYTVIDSSRAVIFRDKYEVQMMMCLNEIHKFSDGILLQIDEALDYRVKEFRINRMNPGLNTRFWTRKDVDRCKAFMFSIQRCLRLRRIFRNLESFVGGRLREGDYRLLKCTE
nr:monodehydroascorbate reductase [Tanacetum cinerariifolium]